MKNKNNGQINNRIYPVWKKKYMVYSDEKQAKKERKKISAWNENAEKKLQLDLVVVVVIVDKNGQEKKNSTRKCCWHSIRKSLCVRVFIMNDQMMMIITLLLLWFIIIYLLGPDHFFYYGSTIQTFVLFTIKSFIRKEKRTVFIHGSRIIVHRTSVKLNPVQCTHIKQ